MTLQPFAVQPAVKNIRFIRKGEVVNLGNVPPGRTVLELLREDLGCTGTKEGCGEGDCGACTVVLGQIEDGALRLRAVNSCIRLAHSIDGMALWTVEDLAAPDGRLHPAQQAMLQCHASQCGFCTPGFVMSLFAIYHKRIAPTLATACASLPPEGALRLRPGEAGAVAPTLATACASLPPGGALRLRPGKAGSAAPAGGEVEDSPALATFQPITRALAQEELSGNLCRCTGYRPILDAAQLMASLPPVALDENMLLSKLELLAQAGYAQELDSAYKLPYTLAELLRLRATHPAAQLVAGCTDVGLWVTKQHRQLDDIIDITQVAELRQMQDLPDHLSIGAAVTLADAFAALVNDRPQLHHFASRFAGLPVRNSGTLGGNVANGSPIGDSMPLLIALGASVVLMSENGQRELPLETLYTGYRTNVMAADEVLAFIRVPKPGSPVLQTAARPETGLLHAVQMRAGASGAAAFSPRPLPVGEGVKAGATNPVRPDSLAPSPFGEKSVETEKSHAGLPNPLAPSPLWGEGWGEGLPEFLRVYKISKRYDDDISAVCLAINLHIAQGVVARASIGAGGVAATPARAVQTEAALTGQPWNLQTVQQAMAVLRAEFTPISDMRASGAYRREVLGNLLQRYWLESQGVQQINLESFVLEERA